MSTFTTSFQIVVEFKDSAGSRKMNRGAWDHDLSQRQMLNQLSHLGALGRRNSKAFLNFTK